MSLLIKCMEIINNDRLRYKDLIIPQSIIEKSKKINCRDEIKYTDIQLKKYYDPHSRIESYQNIILSDIKIDPLPLIIRREGDVYIKFFENHGSFVDYMKDPKNFKGYKTKSDYGKRLSEIVRLTNETLIFNNNIFIDFNDCGGGDLNVYLDAFSPLIGTGLMFYFISNINKIYYYYDGTNIIHKNCEIPIERIKPIENKNIEISFNENTASSAEFIIMLILNVYPNTKLIGKRTKGLMTITKSKIFKWNGERYEIGYTLAPYIFDSNGKRYNGYIKNQ